MTAIDTRPAAEHVEPAEPALESVPSPMTERGKFLVPIGGDMELDAPTVSVDQHLPTRTTMAERADRDRTPRPIFPTWLVDPAERRATARWALPYALHVVLYVLVRLPWWTLLLTVYSPRGLGQFTRWLYRSLFDTEAQALRTITVDKGAAGDYHHLAKLHDKRMAIRARIVLVLLLPVLALALWSWLTRPHWQTQAAGIVVLLGFGYAGRPRDKQLFSSGVLVYEAPRLTSALVVSALVKIGIKDDSTGGGISFPAPIVRDGAGWRADIDLPQGVIVTDVLDKRRNLASALRRPIGCVWPEADNDSHEGRVVLWVADRDPAKSGPVKSVLTSGARRDIFAGIPFGLDPRGRSITVPLIEQNVLIGAQPGQGKTAAVRVIACGAALDPTVELWLHELKGSGDLDPLEKVSYRFASGIDDESIAYAARSLTLLRTELERRTSALKALPRDLCPDRKVTRAIADQRQLGLFPIVCVVDESQNLFADPTHGKQAAEDATFIIKIGRAFGVILVLSTQRPDTQSLPTSISANVSIRFCLRVAGQIEVDMIMGTSSYKNGVRPTLFRPTIDAGTGYLGGVKTDPFVTRVAYLDGHATEKISQRAYALRQAAGTLAGHCLGEVEDVEAADQVLIDVLNVWPAGEDAAWSDTLAELLATTFDRYVAIDATWLGIELRRFGVEIKDRHRKVAGKGVTKKGPARADIEKALGTRRAEIGGAE